MRTFCKKELIKLRGKVVWGIRWSKEDGELGWTFGVHTG